MAEGSLPDMRQNSEAMYANRNIRLSSGFDSGQGRGQGQQQEHALNINNQFPSNVKQVDEGQVDGNGNVPSSSYNTKKIYCIATFRILSVFLLIYCIFVTVLLIETDENGIYNVCQLSPGNNNAFSDNNSSSTTSEPILIYTEEPTFQPTMIPSKHPTNNPSLYPTLSPSKLPSFNPTLGPTNPPTNIPTDIPSNPPSASPTKVPTNNPTQKPTTKAPTFRPTPNPTAPTTKPPTSPTLDCIRRCTCLPPGELCP